MSLRFSRTIVVSGLLALICLQASGSDGKRDTGSALAEKFYERAITALQNAPPDITAGIRCLKEAVRLDPQFARAYFRLGTAYHQAHLYHQYSFRDYGLGVPDGKHPSEEEEALKQALQADPNFALAYVALGELQITDFSDAELTRRSFDAARRMFSRAIEIDPACSSAYRSLAHSYLFQGMDEDYLEQFRKGAAIDPHILFETNELDEFAYNHNRLDEVIEIYRAAIALNPNIPDAWWHLSRVYSHGRNYASAIAAVQEAIRIEPNSFRNHYELAYLYLSYGDRPRAQGEYLYLKQLAESESDATCRLVSSMLVEQLRNRVDGLPE